MGPPSEDRWVGFGWSSPVVGKPDAESSREILARLEAVKAALRTDVYGAPEDVRWHELRDDEFAEWLATGVNAGKVAPWAQDIDRLLRQVRGIRAALASSSDLPEGDTT